MPARHSFYLEDAAGYRLAVHTLPDQKPRAALLLLPPLAEELNKLRRPFAAATKAFAAAGFATLQLDLLGTGDSSGSFADASWAQWQADAHAALAWLRQTHPDTPLVAWGVRAAALLTAPLDAEVDAHLWWQPATQGKTVLQQFVRIRQAAEMAAGRKLGAKEMKEQLAAGQTVEVAGYPLRQPLAAGLEAAELPTPTRPTLWLEAQPREQPELLPASQQWLQARAAPVQARPVTSPQPWAATELEDCDALIEASLAWLHQRWPQ